MVRYRLVSKDYIKASDKHVRLFMASVMAKYQAIEYLFQYDFLPAHMATDMVKYLEERLDTFWLEDILLQFLPD